MYESLLPFRCEYGQQYSCVSVCLLVPLLVLAVYFCQCWIDGVLQTLLSSPGSISLFLLPLSRCSSALLLLLPLPFLLARPLASLLLLLLIVLLCITKLLSSLSSDQTMSSQCVGVCISLCEGFLLLASRLGQLM